MALSRTIYFLFDRVMRKLGDIGVAVLAGDISVNAFLIFIFINMIIDSLAVFINSTGKAVFVADETGFFIKKSASCRKKRTFYFKYSFLKS